jgi:hypothetical protein
LENLNIIKITTVRQPSHRPVDSVYDGVTKNRRL